MALSWLHISDAHFKSGDQYDRDVVLAALVRAVRGFQEQQGRRPDLVFFTGDVAHSGKPAEYDAASRFFEALLDAVGLGRDRLFVIAGNHDVDRDRAVGLARTLASREEADAYFAPGRASLHLSEAQGGFVEWYTGFFEGIRDPPVSSCGPVEVVEAGGLRLAVLPINSALFFRGDDDHEKLCVGRRALADAVRRSRSSHPSSGLR